MILLHSIFSFLIGSIPFSYIITKQFFNKDITKILDKNPGATNAFRAGGIYAGIPSLIFDISKGYIIGVIFNRYILSDRYYLFIILFMGILGHAFSIFLHFKGGKSIATTMGVLFYLYGILPPLFFGVGCFLGLILYKTDIHSTVVGIWALLIYARCFELPVGDLIFLTLVCAFLTYRQLRTPPIEVDILKGIHNLIAQLVKT